MKFSIVVPIKDEVDLIPITLPSYYRLQPDEVIVCVDKPAPPKVIETVKKVARICKAEDKTRIIEVERNPEYRFHQAWVRRTGFRKARNDVILTTDIDIVLDPKIVDFLYLIRGSVGLVSFSKFSPTFRGIVIWLVQKLYRHKSFTGLYAFSKNAWLETEDEESLKRIPRGEDTHLYKHLTKKYDYLFIPDVKNLLLRPHESRKYQYFMGVNRWFIGKATLWRIIISSIIYIRPYMLTGYLKARLK